MKRFSSYLFLLISLFLFSSCIRESFPEQKELELTVGETITFQVTADKAVIWQLDGAQVAIGSSYTFNAVDMGTFRIVATENPNALVNKVEWTVNVTGLTYYRDNDGDGYGDAGNWINDGEQPDGYVEDNTDCNDENPDMHPDMTEVCDNNLDDDCDGHIDSDDNECPSEVDPPQNVIASDLTNSFVTISWDPVAGADYYKVYRAPTPNGPYELVSPDNATLTGTHWDFVESWSDIEAALGDYPVNVSNDGDYLDELDAYNAMARELLTDYKDVGFFAVKAFNVAFESSFSDSDSGQALLEHSDPDLGGMSEFYEIFKIFWQYPLYKAFVNIPDGWAAANWSWNMDDYAGDGNFSAQTHLVNDPALAVSLNWNGYTEGRINDLDGKPNRIMTINGQIYEEIGYGIIYSSSIVGIDGTFFMSDDFPGTVDIAAEIDLSAGDNNTTGVATVEYNGVTYSFPVMLHVAFSLSF